MTRFVFGRLHLGDEDLLRCPRDGAPLSFDGSQGDDRLEDGWLVCGTCSTRWEVKQGITRLFDEAAIQGTDRFMRSMYDVFHAAHDPAVKWLLPVFDSCNEATLRDGFMHRLDLASLAPRDDGEPIRILEVGIGAGANLHLLDRDLPKDLGGQPVEIWGLDLSLGMLADCERALRKTGEHRVRLFMGDAHALPFPSGSFDRVFHVGGIGGYRDPELALAEMARVSVPGAPIVVVDEQLDPTERSHLGHRLLFRLITFYDPDPHCPTELLPSNAQDIVEEQLSRYYYSLSFRVPAPAPRHAE
jgi:ubiquinone/menaquinone biosynthesis C-methylase UbiE/uncharacterized protein YbaR (Trm112 family)